MCVQLSTSKHQILKGKNRKTKVKIAGQNKQNIKLFNMTIQGATRTAQDRTTWKRIHTQKAADACLSTIAKAVCQV